MPHAAPWRSRASPASGEKCHAGVRRTKAGFPNSTVQHNYLGPDRAEGDGRLHRASEGKEEVQIHDYLDVSSPVMLKMYRKRRKAYETMGYTVKEVAPKGAGVQAEFANRTSVLQTM